MNAAIQKPVIYISSLLLIIFQMGCGSGNNQSPDGRSYTFYKNGNPQRAVKNGGGAEYGWVTEWHPNGKVHKQYFLTNGKKHGWYQEWNEGGELLLMGEYMNGTKVGNWSGYPHAGKSRSQRIVMDTLYSNEEILRISETSWNNLDSSRVQSVEIREGKSQRQLAFHTDWLENGTFNSAHFSTKSPEIIFSLLNVMGERTPFLQVDGEQIIDGNR